MRRISKSSNLAVFLITLGLLCIYGCDGDGGGNFQFCGVEEAQERFDNTDCIAEEFVTGCGNIECSTRRNTGIGKKEVSFGAGTDCTVLDCETMQCDVRVGASDTEIGLVSELMAEDMGSLLSGLVSIETQESPFECFVFLP